MTEEEWLASRDPVHLFDRVKRTASDRKLRLFACYLCETYQREFKDERIWAAVETSLKLSDGEVGEPERITALDVVRDAIIDIEGSEHLWQRSGLAFPMCTLGTREMLERVPLLALQQFDCNFYANPRVVECLGLRDIFGNPFRLVLFDPEWRTSTALALARGIYDERAFDRMPILADALQDAGCENEDILNHLRDPHATHVRGCWALDLVLGKE
jgi:hypothetical protein